MLPFSDCAKYVCGEKGVMTASLHCSVSREAIQNGLAEKETGDGLPA